MSHRRGLLGLLVSGLLALGAMPAGAAPYTGLDLSFFTARIPATSDAAPRTVQLRLGLPFPQWGLSLEGRFGAGLGGDTVVRNDGARWILFLPYHYGVYAIGELPVAEQARLRSMVGYTRALIEEDVAGVISERVEAGLSFGLGGEWIIDRRGSFVVEYARLLDNERIGLYALQLGWKFPF